MKPATIRGLGWIAAGLVVAAYAAGAIVGGYPAGWYVLAAGGLIAAVGVVRLARPR